MSDLENARDFILQQLVPKKPPNASSSSSSSSSHPIEFVDPAIAAVGRSVPLVASSAHHDHFPVRSFLPHQVAAKPPPGFQIPDSRVQAVVQGFIDNGGGLEWNQWPLTFGSIPFKLEHQDCIGYGASQSGDRVRNGEVLGSSTRTGGFVGYGGGDHQGFSEKVFLNLSAPGGNHGFMRKGLGHLGGSGDHQGFSQNGVETLSDGGNYQGFSRKGLGSSSSARDNQRFQQKRHGNIGGSRDYQGFLRNGVETLGGSGDKEVLSQRRLGNLGGNGDNQGFSSKGEEFGTGRRGDLQNRSLNSAKGMGRRWVSRNERREGERPKERREENGTVNYFHTGESKSVQVVQNLNSGPDRVEFEGEELDSNSWLDRQSSQKENHHLVDTELSSSFRRAADASRFRRKPEGRAGQEEKTNEGVNNGVDDSDNIDDMMGSLVVDNDATENYSRHRRDGYGGKGKLQGPSTWFRGRRRDLMYRSDLEMHTPRFLSIFESLIPVEEEKAKQKQLILMLEKLVTREWPKARLLLYGSCANTFGFPKSDIDVCLSIDKAESSKLDILLKLADILKSDNLQNVQAFTRARVPIVKLMDPDTGISCDICINNALAVVNTKLLRDYAQIDIRLRQLAFIVKHWAKARQVNETYRGTLSSYAYVLMCIHFLQLRSPAILPCLQRMTATYVVIVDGIEYAYYDKVEGLKGFGLPNRETIGQLLCAFFNYWAYEHDYANSVISVRTGSFLSKREKDWTRRIGNDRHLICIEDPFETSHDLGRVVDKFSIKVLRDEFGRAADILQHDPNPSVTLFEPYSEV